MGKIKVEVGVRKLEWELDDESIDMTLQNLIAVFGPAKESE